MDTPAFLVRKTEKLTSALYKVTDFMPDGEPLKGQLRASALDFLDAIMSFTDDNREVRPSTFNRALFLISKTIALLEVSYMGSFVSQMNFSILRDEYRELRRTLLEFKESRHAPIRLDVEESARTVSKGPTTFSGPGRLVEAGGSSKGSVRARRNGTVPGRFGESDGSRSRRAIQPHDSSPAEGARAGAASVRGGSDAGRSKTAENGGKERRRRLILDVVKQRGEVGIKDIATDPAISQMCSEKTIQRELSDLASTGVLKKKGVRRWSRYYV